VVRQLSGGALKSVLTSIGMTVTNASPVTAASRWVPVIVPLQSQPTPTTTRCKSPRPRSGCSRLRRWSNWSDARLQGTFHRVGAPALNHAGERGALSSVIPSGCDGIALVATACS